MDLSSGNKYLVCYILREGGMSEDKYLIFTNGSSEENYEEALKCYNALLEADNIFSVNLCRVEKSTDY